MKKVNTFPINPGNDKLLPALFGGVIAMGSTLAGVAVVAMACYY